MAASTSIWPSPHHIVDGGCTRCTLVKVCKGKSTPDFQLDFSRVDALFHLRTVYARIARTVQTRRIQLTLRWREVDGRSNSFLGVREKKHVRLSTQLLA